MHKLVILVEPLEDSSAFDDAWPQILHLVESIPGLRREATSRVDRVLFGKYQCIMVHELFFDSFEALKEAMSSPEGRAAGELLQKMTGGRMTLLVADHKEDDMENILKYRTAGVEDERPETR